MYHTNFNAENWLLKPMQTVSTLPPDFHGTNACAEIRLHPSGRLLYVSNRGHDSIAGFRINQQDGRLTSLGQTSTEKTPLLRLEPLRKIPLRRGRILGPFD